jgi:hypothetical protein
MVLVGDRRVGFDVLLGIDTPAVWIQQVGAGEPRRNRTFNPQIKSRIEAVFWITRVPSGTRAISLSDSRLALIH